MPVGQGHDAYLGFATQSTLGTLAARTKFLDIISESLAAQLTRTHSDLLGSASRRQYVETGAQSGGVVELEGNYEGLETLLYHAIGAKTSAQQGTTTAYKHTLSLAKALPSPGLSIEVERDIRAFFYEGCKINQITFTQEPNAYLRVALDLLGRNETDGAATTPTFPKDLPIHQPQFAFTIDGTAIAVNRFDLTINNNLEQRPKLGDAAPKEIIRNGAREVSGSFEADFEDTAQYAKFIENASIGLVAAWTGAAIASTYKYEMKLSMPKCYYEGQTPQVGGRGPITVPFTFMAMEQTRAAQDELEVELTNTAAAIA